MQQNKIKYVECVFLKQQTYIFFATTITKATKIVATTTTKYVTPT